MVGKTGHLGHKICMANSLNDTQHQVVVETKIATAENREAEAFEKEMQDSILLSKTKTQRS